MPHLRPLCPLRSAILPLGLAAAFAALAACQPEYNAFVGYKREAFSIRSLRGKPVAVYVTGGRAEGLAQVEGAIQDAVDAGEVTGTAQLSGFMKDKGLAQVQPSDFPLMNSDYRPEVAAKALASLVETVRANTKAPYLVACVGWLGASKLEGRTHAWEANPMASHTGSVKVYVVDVATGAVVAITHAVVLSPDAANGHVGLSSRKLQLEKGVWERTAKEAVEKLETVK